MLQIVREGRGDDTYLAFLANSVATPFPKPIGRNIFCHKTTFSPELQLHSYAIQAILLTSARASYYHQDSHRRYRGFKEVAGFRETLRGNSGSSWCVLRFVGQFLMKISFKS